MLINEYIQLFTLLQDNRKQYIRYPIVSVQHYADNKNEYLHNIKVRTLITNEIFLKSEMV